MNELLKNDIAIKSQYIHISIPYYEDDYQFWGELGENNPFYSLVTSKERWEITVNLSSHTIIEWQKEIGICQVFAKVRDEGIYKLLDENKIPFCQLSGYVPNKILPPTNGYGDYLELKIDENGVITNWYDKCDFSEFINKGEAIKPEDFLPITDVQHLWTVLEHIVLPLSNKIFKELTDALYPNFLYSSEYVYLAQNKKQSDWLPINPDYCINRLKSDVEILQYISLVRFTHITYGVASPRNRMLGPLRIHLDYNIEFKSKSYFMPIINKEYTYNETPNQNEIALVVLSIKQTAQNMLKDKKSGYIIL